MAVCENLLVSSSLVHSLIYKERKKIASQTAALIAPFGCLFLHRGTQQWVVQRMLEINHPQITLSIAYDLILLLLLIFQIACFTFLPIQGKILNSLILFVQMQTAVAFLIYHLVMFTGISQASVSGMSTMLLVHFMHSILSIVLRRRRVFACTRSSYVILIGVTLSSIIQDQMPVVTGMLMVSWKLTTLVVRRDGMF